jgi:hypothetical protein
LITDSELRIKLSENARRTIEHGFSLDYAIKRWEDLFQLALSKSVKKAEHRKWPVFLNLPLASKLLPEHKTVIGVYIKLALKMFKISRKSAVSSEQKEERDR